MPNALLCNINTVWFPLDDSSAVWPATEAISVMMEYCCSEAMIIVVSFWFLCTSDEANMQMRGPAIWQHPPLSLGNREDNEQRPSVLNANVIWQDVSEIMCDFVLANEIRIVTTWPGNVHVSGRRRLEEHTLKYLQHAPKPLWYDNN